MTTIEEAKTREEFEQALDTENTEKSIEALKRMSKSPSATVREFAKVQLAQYGGDYTEADHGTHYSNNR